MSLKPRRNSCATKKYKLFTAQPPSEVGFEELPDGARVHKLKTVIGTLGYAYSREVMQQTLWTMCGHFILCARAGGPLDFNEIAQSVGAGSPYHLIVDLDQSFLDELEASTQHALELLDALAPQILLHVSEQIVFEVFYRAVCDRWGQGSFQFPASESELLTLLSEHAVKRLKQRVPPRRRPSRKLEWTPERCEEYLVKYEYALKVLQQAKGIYQRNRDDEWRRMIKAIHPALPDSFIKRLPLKGEAEPSDLAREYAAELCGVNSTSYLKKVIGQAKEARLRKAA